MEKLDTDETLDSNITSSDITNPVFNVIQKFEDHPSIKKIKLFMTGEELQL